MAQRVGSREQFTFSRLERRELGGYVSVVTRQTCCNTQHFWPARGWSQVQSLVGAAFSGEPSTLTASNGTQALLYFKIQNTSVNKHSGRQILILYVSKVVLTVISGYSCHPTTGVPTKNWLQPSPNYRCAYQKLVYQESTCLQ